MEVDEKKYHILLWGEVLESLGGKSWGVSVGVLGRSWCVLGGMLGNVKENIQKHREITILWLPEGVIRDGVGGRGFFFVG